MLLAISVRLADGFPTLNSGSRPEQNDGVAGSGRSAEPACRSGAGRPEHSGMVPLSRSGAPLVCSGGC